MTRAELLQLIANGENSGVEFKRDDVRPEQLAKEIVALAIHAELLPVSGTDLADLDLERLHDYLSQVLTDPDVPARPEAWVSRLTALGFMTGRPGGDPVCTIAGIVLFGRRPRWALRQAGVRWMAFAGDSMDYAAADDALLDEPLVGLWRTREGSRVLERGGLLEGLTERMRPFVSEEASELSDGLRRERRWHYPVAALREALVNALAHRDWTRVEDVEVVRYANRLEITSPGALQNSMTVEKMLAGQRSPRNPLIVDVLRDYGYVDARGMGVRTKIVPLLISHNGAAPEFEATDDYLRVRMFRNPAAAGIGGVGPIGLGIPANGRSVPRAVP
jgi:ATP-dependent DNA helicase RecG